MTELLKLPARLDSSGAPPLLEMLLAGRGRPLAIDVSGVEMVGALALEVVIAAGKQWAADGQTLTIANLSQRWTATCEALGLIADAPWSAMDQGDCFA